jgi:hypothetical protein
VLRDKEVNLEDGESSHTQVDRGKGVSKEWEVNKRREVCEWEG